jgi:hypothetical protein
MKKTKKKILFTAAELFWFPAAPVALIIMQYGGTESASEGAVFKLSFGGILLLAAIFWVFKRVFISRKIQDMRAQCNTHIADLKTESDAGRKKYLEDEIRLARTIETVLNAVLPMLLMIAAVVVCYALERGLTRLYGVLGLTTLCYAVSTVFRVLAARQVEGKHGGDNESKKDKRSKK